jgi:hypothetical protein
MFGSKGGAFSSSNITAMLHGTTLKSPIVLPFYSISHQLDEIFSKKDSGLSLEERKNKNAEYVKVREVELDRSD